MAFTADERVQIRKWIGIAEVFHDKDPRVESAITSIENVGIESETLIRTYLAKLVLVEQAIDDETLNCIGNVRIDKIQQDNVRGVKVMEQLGRKYVGIICRALAMEGPISDAFSPPPTLSP